MTARAPRLFLLLVGLGTGLSACAGLPRRGEEIPASTMPPAARRAWAELLAGDGPAAAASLAAPENARDPWALFGRAVLAFEQGKDETAVDATLGLLEVAAGRAPGTGDATADLLASAAASRLFELFRQLPAPEAAETRLLAVDPGRLPWPARLLWDEAAAFTARRRGDARQLARGAERVGCLTELVSLGRLGRLPHRDLLRAPEPAALAHGPRKEPLFASGCLVSLPRADRLPGVEVLQGRFRGGAGGATVVLDYRGPAALRVDGGKWRKHHRPHVYPPDWSAHVFTLEPGGHDIEIRLGTFGNPGQLRLLVAPADAGPAPVSSPADAERAAALELAQGLLADAALDTDQSIRFSEHLRRRAGFAAGLAAAATLVARDFSRPATVTADESLSLCRKAVDRDPTLVRCWRELAQGELRRDRGPQAIALAERARAAAPGWWPATATLIEALRSESFDFPADQALDQALVEVGAGDGACSILGLALSRAQQRYRVEEEEALVERLSRCDVLSSARGHWLRRRGALAEAERLLERQAAVAAAPSIFESDLADVLLARGQAGAALNLLRRLVERRPDEAQLRIRYGDTAVAAGLTEHAAGVFAEVVAAFPGDREARQVARLSGLPLPLESRRVDGRAAIAAYKEAHPEYPAPAVLVLDRTVARVFPDGTQVISTHNIVHVKTKDGVGRWGEVEVPPEAEILALRTHKPDGSVREPEQIAGKATVSAAELGTGDFVEWEMIEYRSPNTSLSPGFLGDRFYFQSVELPLHVSEYVLIVPQGLPVDFDARAGAPAPLQEEGPDGTRLFRFVARAMPQLFAEPAALPAIEWIPSVRASSGVALSGWSRLLSERLEGIDRATPPLRRLARRLEREAKAAGRPVEETIVAWVLANIDREDGLFESATESLARRRGNRAAVILALCREVGIRARITLARSTVTAAADDKAVAQELDDFSEVLVHFPDSGHFVDPRFEHAPFGYLPSHLRGAAALAVDRGELVVARTPVADSRLVSLRIDVAADGSATGVATERLAGWSAMTWAEEMESLRQDRSKLRQRFEQAWLSQQFPGARLEGLLIEFGSPREEAVGKGKDALLRYSFSSPRFAAVSGDSMRVSPSFFRSLWGRRFATEGVRRTGLVLGPDVPLSLVAELRFPAGAKVADPGRSGDIEAGGGAGAVFGESREVQEKAGGPLLILRRRAHLPLGRVSPKAYPALAGSLREVDLLEQSEIHVTLPTPAARAPTPGSSSGVFVSSGAP